MKNSAKPEEGASSEPRKQSNGCGGWAYFHAQRNLQDVQSRQLRHACTLSWTTRRSQQPSRRRLIPPKLDGYEFRALALVLALVLVLVLVLVPVLVLVLVLVLAHL